MNGAARYQKLITEGNTSTNTQTILSDTQYFNNQTNKFKSSRWRTRGNMLSDIKIDSLQSIMIKADGSYGESQSISSFYSEALTSSKVPVNQNNKQTLNNSYNANFNVTMLY